MADSSAKEALAFLLKRYLDEILPDDPAANYLRSMFSVSVEQSVIDKQIDSHTPPKDNQVSTPFVKVDRRRGPRTDAQKRCMGRRGKMSREEMESIASECSSIGRALILGLPITDESNGRQTI